MAPNKFDYDDGTDSYTLSGSQPLQATRTQGAISDGTNAILVSDGWSLEPLPVYTAPSPPARLWQVDDVQLHAIVRTANESILRYRQVISVGSGCTAVAGHPCAYPMADFSSTDRNGVPNGRTSSCQREAEHGGRWYDTDANVTGLVPSKPFQVRSPLAHALSNNASPKYP